MLNMGQLSENKTLSPAPCFQFFLFVFNQSFFSCNPMLARIKSKGLVAGFISVKVIYF